MIVLLTVLYFNTNIVRLKLLNADIRELYPGYWVLVDNVNSRNGLSCIILNAETLEDAIVEVEMREYDFVGDGSSFDANYAKLVFTNDEMNIHIFEID